MRLSKAKSYPFERTAIQQSQGSLIKLNTFEHKLTLKKSIPALDVAF